MNISRKNLVLYFALLLTFFKVTEVSATVPAWFPTADSPEVVEASDSPSIWASEEIFQIIKLPEYSKHQFGGSTVIPASHYTVFRNDFEGFPALYQQRDLKTLIRILLFPFHFFL